MAITILPLAGDPGGALAAQAQLQTIIDDVLTVVMIVYGEGIEIERARDVADELATTKPQIRRAVWCRDPSVLSPAQKQHYFRDSKVTVSVGLANKIADALDIDEAQSRMTVELAFARAEAQGGDDN